jgi:hypothetical protein
MAAIIALGLIGAAGVGAAGASAGQKKAEKGRTKALEDAYRSLGMLNESAMSGSFMGQYGMEEIFGSVPEWEPYNMVDLNQSQLDTIAGNLAAFPSASQLSTATNDFQINEDLKRIRRLIPEYDKNINRMGDVTRDLLLGRLPYGDVLDITANRSELAGSLGTPGGASKATLRDLGLSQLQATQQGASLFQQMMGVAEAVNPQSTRLRPQQMYFQPQERAQLDIQQAMLDQQSRQSGAFLEAMPDPAAAALFNQQVGMATMPLGMGGDYGASAEAAKYQAIQQAMTSGLSLYAGRTPTSGTTNTGFGWNQYVPASAHGTSLSAPAGGARSIGAYPQSMPYTAYYSRQTGMSPALI